MPYKVRLRHAKALEEAGLYRQKVVGIAAATEYPTFTEAQRAMTAWLDHGGKERREQWTGEVVPASAEGATQ